MKQQLEQLARLQEIDDQLAMLERSKGDYPQRIEELENTLNMRLQDAESVEKSQDELEKEKRQLERHVSDHEGKLEKLQTRLAEVKTNKEWDALQKEMDAVKEGLSDEEERLLEIMEELDTIGAAAETDDAELKDYRSSAETEIQDLKEKLGSVDMKMAKIRSERDALTVQIDDNLKRIYNRVKQGKQGTAVVPVVRGACGGCYNRIPPQTLTEVRRAEAPVTCENCGRIIIWFGEDEIT
jgi:predicted  nucleic acid-binding Zn-ribbon protein